MKAGVWLTLLGLLVLTPLPAPAQEKPLRAGEPPLGQGIRSVTFSPDAALLAATFGEPKERGRVVLWNVATHKELWSHVEDAGVPIAVFAPDGKTMAIGSYDHKARLLDTQTGRVLKVFTGHTNYVRAVAIRPDNKTLATGSWDGTVKIWDLATGMLQRTLPGPDNFVFTMAYSPDGKWLMAADPGLRVYEAATGKEKNAKLQTVAIASGRSIQLFRFPLPEPAPQEKERMRRFLVQLDDDSYETRETASRELLALGIVTEPDLRRLMTASPSAEVRIRCRRLRDEVLAKPRAKLSGTTGDLEGLAFSPDGTLLAGGGKSGVVFLWKTRELEERARLTPAGSTVTLQH